MKICFHRSPCTKKADIDKTYDPHGGLNSTTLAFCMRLTTTPELRHRALEAEPASKDGWHKITI